MAARPASAAAPSPASGAEVFQLRAVTLDYYLAPPRAPFGFLPTALQGGVPDEVPVLRVFGSTPGGQRACLHLHGATPHFYVRYEAAFPQDEGAAARFVLQLGLGLDSALQRYALQRGEPQRRHHVASAQLVRARPFYGYHVGDALFVRVALLNPDEVKRAAALLSEGAVLATAFAVHEAHVPFILQAMMDLNLAGMALLSLETQRVVFRGELPAEARAHQRVEACSVRDARGGPALQFRAAAAAATAEGGPGSAASVETPGPQLWTRACAAAGRAQCSPGAAPQTTCELEADALARDVLNLRDAPRTRLEDATSDMQLVQSLAPLWAEERLRARAAEPPLPPPRRGSSPERAPPGPESEFAQRARAALRDAAKAELDLAPVHASAEPAGGAPAASAAPVRPQPSDDHGERGSLMACTQAANTFFRDPQPARSASFITVEGPIAAPDTRFFDEDVVMTQVQRDSQQNDEEMGALLQHLLTSPRDEHQLAGAMEAPSPVEAGSQGVRPALRLQEEWAAFAAEHELCSEQELMEQLRADQLETERDFEAILNSQLPMSEPEPSDSEDEPPPEPPEEDAAEEEPPAKRRAVTSAQREADRQLMPPPPPPPPAPLAPPDTASPGDSAQAQGSREQLSPAPLHRERWRRAAPSTAALRQSLVEHGLHEYVPEAYRGVARHGSMVAKSKSVPRSSAARGGQPLVRSRRGLAGWRAMLSDASWQLQTPHQAAQRSPRMFMLTPLRRPPRRAALVASMTQPLASQPASSRAHPTAAPAAGLESLGSDDECSEEEAAPRPASPKYGEERVDYLQALKFCGCEAIPAGAEAAGPAATPASPASAAAAATVHRGPAQAIAQGAVGHSRGRSFGRSQLTGPSRTHESTPASQAGFATASQSAAHVTVMVLEVFAAVRDNLLADPEQDPVQCVSICLSDDGYGDGETLQEISIVVDEELPAPRHCVPGAVSVHSVPSEEALLLALTTLVRSLDPDFIMGFDVHAGSLGYLTERCAHLGGDFVDLLQRLSRTPEHMPPGGLRNDDYGRDHGAGIWITGRGVLNFWRIARSELVLGSYTFEAAMMALLQRRVPAFARSTLGMWYEAPTLRWRVITDLAERARGCLLMCTQLDLVGRTSEMARVFGIDFNSVLIRGSQFRVESMMLRLAHSQNFVALTPSKTALAESNGPAVIALLLDAASGYYTSPVVVLDFQSLYPSQVIAYNLCYSTCLGMAPPSAGGSLAGVTRKFGSGQLSLQPGVIPSLVDRLHIAPNGAVFVPPSVVPGVLPRMLSEILDTRIMVKAALKSAPATARALQRSLTARQLGLKLIANVTYGYTAANFSGRMPLVELADAIVSSGRDTLERAINLVKANTDWRAEVIYGNTDSMFVHLPGRSRAEAFRIGAEIAAAVTAANPKPVKLQLEKVYEPCILVTKNRYVGMAYSSATSDKAVFDAKGIETVRRDTCGLVVKTMERSLRLLFATHDLGVVRKYLERQWLKVLSDRMSVADAVFAKEVRLGTYAAERAGGNGTLPFGALVAERERQRDPRAAAPYGQRVPYVLCEGAPGASVSSRVRSPHDLLNNRGDFKLCSEYYVVAQRNALDRLLSLAGGDLKRWYDAMPKPKARSAHLRAAAPAFGPGAHRRNMITAWYSSDQCAVCGTLLNVSTQASPVVCDACKQAQPDVALLVLHGRVSKLETQLAKLHSVCLNCGGDDGTGRGAVVCVSLDCPVLLERRKRLHELAACQQLLNQATATDW